MRIMEAAANVVGGNHPARVQRVDSPVDVSGDETVDDVVVVTIPIKGRSDPVRSNYASVVLGNDERREARSSTFP